jgi:hypothetical protein
VPLIISLLALAGFTAGRLQSQEARQGNLAPKKSSKPFRQEMEFTRPETVRLQADRGDHILSVNGYRANERLTLVSEIGINDDERAEVAGARRRPQERRLTGRHQSSTSSPCPDCRNCPLRAGPPG